MTFYNLYYEDTPILENASENEFISFLEDFEIDYGWEISEPEDYIFFYNQHYHYDKYKVNEIL